jgi:hypothetical protein
MANEQKVTADVLALERHLEIYGADQTRWPQQARERFALVLARDARARALLAEARALDRLLDRAPLPGAGRERALCDRIVAKVSSGCNGARRDQGKARVIELPPRREQSRTTAAAPRILWQTAALLAASLAIGVYLGSAGGLTPAVEAMVENVGLRTQVDPYQLSLLDDSGTLGEEDPL